MTDIYTSQHVSHHAILPPIQGMHLPFIALPVDAHYQFAVTCGAESASSFFYEHPEITLHAHLPASLECFVQKVQKNLSGLSIDWRGRDKQITDAFIAGYLGRIQQELRLMHPIH